MNTQLCQHPSCRNAAAFRIVAAGVIHHSCQEHLFPDVMRALEKAKMPIAVMTIAMPRELVNDDDLQKLKEQMP